MITSTSTTGNINTFTQFRQAVYIRIFQKRFRKEALGWTLPRFQNAQAGDTWTQLVALAHLSV